ncbi:hypothetical protein NG798_25785, partial [Ancylothrix sp. C2]|uniref:hypothetical protein n=1 Tax=Ancylothrix sp. D3o TaxID=2953691 RepID=UPI0021BB03AC
SLAPQHLLANREFHRHHNIQGGRQVQWPLNIPHPWHIHGFITFREAGEVQGIGEVGGASGIQYGPVLAGRPMKSVDVGGGGEADNLHFLYAGLKQP